MGFLAKLWGLARPRKKRCGLSATTMHLLEQQDQAQRQLEDEVNRSQIYILIQRTLQQASSESPQEGSPSDAHP